MWIGNVKYFHLFFTQYSLEYLCYSSAQELRAFESLCKQLLMDIQERFVYRTYIYIKSDILSYTPAQGDLAYPEKLEMMEVCCYISKKIGHPMGTILFFG